MANRFFCSMCGQQLEADDSLVGQKVPCTACGGETRVPEPPPALLTPAPVAAELPAGKPVESAAPAMGMPVGKPLEQLAATKPTVATTIATAAPATVQPTALAQPAPVAKPKTDDEDYELVYDDDESPKSPAPAARAVASGAAAGQPVPAAAAPQGLPVGKPLQAAKTPQGTPVGKPAPTKTAPQAAPVGKPVSPSGHVPPTGRAVPAAAAAPQPAAQVPSARPVEKPKPRPSAGTQTPAGKQSAAPGAPVGKPVAPAARAGQRAPAAGASAAAPSKAAASPASGPSDLLPELNLSDVVADDFGGFPMGGETAEVGRVCSRCLTRLSGNSNVCPQCGFDSSVAAVSVPQELPAEIAAAPIRIGRQSGSREMRTVRLGLYGVCVAQVLVLIAVILQLIATLGDEPLDFEAPSALAWATAGFAGVGFICSCVSSVLSLFVPTRSGARGMIYLKSACDAATIGLIAAFYQQLLPGNMLWLVPVLPIVSILLFELFMRKLAMFVDHDGFVRTVEKLLWKTLGFIGIATLCALFSVMIGSERFMLARVVGVVGWMYILFQFTLIAQQLVEALLTAAASDRPAEETAAAT
jgi:predicted RNA-binding Zn-ribbon protein involved in translation (DUF1610 family)